jgi:hypothetical protein
MKRLLLMSLALISAPAAAQTVLSAEGDWSQVPEIRPQGTHRMGFKTMDEIEALAKSGQCSVPGLTRRRIDLTVPFVVEFNPKGEVQTVVVRKLGCERLESIMGGAILQLAQAGEYRSTGQNQAGWYQSELSFTLQ